MPDGETQQALDTLPVEFRTVVWLSDVEELSYREIAEIIIFQFARKT
ncbi:MAG: sigma factor-like helix-turn-helix DNA-binding protein [Blastocatellia bacterium]